MTAITLIVNHETIHKMKMFYAEQEIEHKNPHACFVAKTNGCTITLYHSKKVLFQGKNATEESAIWESIHQADAQEKNQTSSTQSDKFFPHIGSDEVGTGDYFGPITVCAAFIDEQVKKQLTPLHIQDSKAMTDSYICEVAPKLKELIPFSLLILTNNKYNQLNQAGYNQGKIKAYLHNQAILHLLKKIGCEDKPPKIIIDQFAEKGVYYNYLKDVPVIAKANVFFETKAENKFLAVACGAVLARYAFLQKINQMSKQWEMEIPKGASRKVDQAAASFIKKHDMENLSQVAKLHFANTEKAKNYL